MNALEKQLLQEAGGGAEPRLVVRSRTRVDTGRWWWRTAGWLCVMDDELILLAVSRRRYVEHVPFADCRDSRYVPASGELVLAPVETLQFNRFRMTPREALKVLGMILTEPSRDGVSLTRVVQSDADGDETVVT